jgi:acyl carrier protein
VEECVESSASLSETRDQVRAYILKHHLKGEAPAKLRDETPLQSSGILDSLAMLDIIAFLEQHYSIKLSASETGVDGFDRIQEIADVVVSKETR